jgi:hypothetical protein
MTCSDRELNLISGIYTKIYMRNLQVTVRYCYIGISMRIKREPARNGNVHMPVYYVISRFHSVVSVITDTTVICVLGADSHGLCPSDHRKTASMFSFEMS